MGITDIASSAWNRVKQTSSSAVDSVKQAVTRAATPAASQVRAQVEVDSFAAASSGVPKVKKLGPVVSGAVARSTGPLMMRGADDLMKAGRYDEAARIYRQLEQPPYAGEYVGLSPPTKGGVAETKTSTSVPAIDKFDSTFDKVAATRLAQIDQLRDMEKVMGKKVDPHDANQVRAYFQALSDRNPKAPLREEFQRYLNNFFVHPGGTTTYKVPEGERTARFAEILANQPVDGACRKLVNCEGMNHLTRSILGEVKGKGGKPRFDVYFAGVAEHVLSGVFDRNTQTAFKVSDTHVRELEDPNGMVKKHGSKGVRIVTPFQPEISAPRGGDRGGRAPG